MIRSLGIVSYVMLAVGICLGILYSFPFWNGKQKGTLYKVHTLFTNVGTLFGLLHGVITVIDQYMPYSWSEVLIPFAAKQHPVLNGLGTLAGYGLLLLIFTSDIRNKLKRPLWHAIHLLSYPIFIAAFIHGCFLGTDTQQPGIKLMYFVSIAAIVALTVARGMVHKPRQTLLSPGGKAR
jgi:DMSO/TMAO reductase YedYZ heme-binding membrane subunit